jgi:hypothetical protein
MLQTKSPARYQSLIDLRTAVQVASEAVDRVKSWIRSDVGVTSDPRAAIASDSQ